MRVEIDLPDEVIEGLFEAVTTEVLSRLDRPEPAPSPYVTVEEAAAYLRCSRQRIHDLLSARRLRRFKDGSRTLLDRVEVEAWVEEAE
jgi:excisionase family DNA binding protein